MTDANQKQPPCYGMYWEAIAGSECTGCAVKDGCLQRFVSERLPLARAQVGTDLNALSAATEVKPEALLLAIDYEKRLKGENVVPLRQPAPQAPQAPQAQPPVQAAPPPPPPQVAAQTPPPPPPPPQGGDISKAFDAGEDVAAENPASSPIPQAVAVSQPPPPPPPVESQTPPPPSAPVAAPAPEPEAEVAPETEPGEQQSTTTRGKKKTPKKKKKTSAKKKVTKKTSASAAKKKKKVPAKRKKRKPASEVQNPQKAGAAKVAAAPASIKQTKVKKDSARGAAGRAVLSKQAEALRQMKVRWTRERDRRPELAAVTSGSIMRGVHKGNPWEVKALTGRYLYKGQEYPTLQSVCTAITGTVSYPRQMKEPGNEKSRPRGTRKTCNWSAKRFFAKALADLAGRS